MESKTWYEMTPQERINEAGSEPDCPFCRNPRVTRNTYIRCNRCGVNWFRGTDISRDPRMKPMPDIESIQMEASDGAAPVNAISSPGERVNA